MRDPIVFVNRLSDLFLVLNTLQYACQKQPMPNQPFYIKPENIFNWNPPSNYSNITTSYPPSPGGGGLSHDARIALVISIPVGAFVILSLLFAWLFVNRHNRTSRNPQSVVNRRSYYNEKHISKSSANWNRPPRQGFDQSRSKGTASLHPTGYPAPLNSQNVDMPAPLRPQKSNSSIPFSKVFGSPMFDQPMPAPLRTQKSNHSIPFLQPTVYSPPPPIPESKKYPSLVPRPERSLGRPSGLVSWERIAIQNAQIRASQGPSPSPVSPLTKVKVVQLPRSASHRPSIPFRHQSPFRHDSPFHYDPPFRQDSLIPLYRQDSQTQTLLRRPSSSTLGTTHLQNSEPRLPRRHRSHKSRHSKITEVQPPQREGTPGQGEALSSDAPPIPISAYNSTIAPMMPLSPIRPVSPILKSCPASRPGTANPDTIPRTEMINPTTTACYVPHLMNPETLPPDTFRSEYMRADTPNPDDGILARRSGASGVMRSGSGKSRGSRKEVRWSKDVDYEDGWGTASRKSRSSKSGSGKSIYCGWNE